MGISCVVTKPSYGEAHPVGHSWSLVEKAVGFKKLWEARPLAGHAERAARKITTARAKFTEWFRSSDGGLAPKSYPKFRRQRHHDNALHELRALQFNSCFQYKLHLESAAILTKQTSEGHP